MTLRKSAFQSKGLSLAGMLSNVIIYNLSKPDIHRRAVATNDDILEAFSGLRIGLRILINPKFFSHFATSTRTREGEFCESIKKGLPTIANPVYGYSAPAKSGAGRGNPNYCMATPDAPSVFFCVDATAHPFTAAQIRTLSMVELVGRRSRLPESIQSGISTPANVTAISERGNSGGDSNTLYGGCHMATIPTQKPSFVWLIAAVRRDYPTITAKIHHIAAETEQEARRTLARDHVCFFAGRIRTGGAHD